MKNFKRHIVSGWLMTGLLLCCLSAGGMDPGRPAYNKRLYENKLDTLTLGERVSFRTNAIDWIALTPNVGVELTLGTMNWSRWTLGLSGRWNPSTHTTHTSYNAYDMTDVRLELRRYMHGRSSRRSWFVGAYGTYGKHNLKLAHTGYDGTHAVAGLSAGLVAPLYGYRNGSSLDFEVAVGAGVVLAKHSEYEKQGNSFVTTKTAESFRLCWEPLTYVAACDALRVSLVYHFGPSVADRYKRRIVVDERYRLHLNELEIRRDSTQRANEQRRAERRDSLEKVDYERRFEKQRLELDRRYVSDSIQRAKREAVQEAATKKEE